MTSPRRRERAPDPPDQPDPDVPSENDAHVDAYDEKEFTHAAGDLQIASRLGRAAAYGALAAALGLSIYAATSTAAPPAPAAAAVAPESSGASGYAMLLLQQYLAAGKEDTTDLTALYPDTPTPEGPPHAFVTSMIVPIQITTGAHGVWSITMQTLLSEASADGGYGPPTLRCWRIALQQPPHAAAYIALAAPAEVTCPVIAVAGESDYRAQLGSGPINDTVSAWAAAYLTGHGEVGRYLSPDAVMSAISPPPYTAVEVTTIQVAQSPEPPQELMATPASGAEISVLVTLSAQTAALSSLELVYPLSLRARDGRWEVASVDPAPQVTSAASTPEQDAAPGTPSQPTD